MFAIHQPVTNLQRTDNLNPRHRWYLALHESNQMKSAYVTIHPDKNPPPQNGCQLKSVFFFFKSTGFTSSTFPIQPDFSQNQPAAITTKYPFSPDIEFKQSSWKSKMTRKWRKKQNRSRLSKFTMKTRNRAETVSAKWEHLPKDLFTSSILFICSSKYGFLRLRTSAGGTWRLGQRANFITSSKMEFNIFFSATFLAWIASSLLTSLVSPDDSPYAFPTPFLFWVKNRSFHKTRSCTFHVWFVKKCLVLIFIPEVTRE